jgi:RNA 2',3'-cyclic 3'-phosphodiesterase
VRLFVAIDVSDETRAQLRRVRDALEARLAANRSAPRVTWVTEAAAHVTVRFIGEVSEETADRIRSALSAPIDRRAYLLEFEGLGAFPNTRRPRTIWIGATNGQSETAALASAVNARLDPIIGPGEARDFRAHLTVARVKEQMRFDWDAALAAIDARRSRSAIDHVTLYQSRTSPKGPTYTALLKTPLT